jgi:hypothetical protein
MQPPLQFSDRYFRYLFIDAWPKNGPAIYCLPVNLPKEKIDYEATCVSFCNPVRALVRLFHSYNSHTAGGYQQPNNPGHSNRD